METLAATIWNASAFALQSSRLHPEGESRSHQSTKMNRALDARVLTATMVPAKNLDLIELVARDRKNSISES